MNKNLLWAMAILLSACNSNQTGQTDMAKPGADSAAAIKSPYQIAYSSKFMMDNPKNAETLLTIWKDWDNGDLSAHKELFADSVDLYFADGTNIHAKRDSAMAAAQAARNSLAASVDRVDAIMAVKSTDKNENWALIWGMEKDTDKKGKVDSFYLQETWRFNKDGKADLVYQFRQSPPQAKK